MRVAVVANPSSGRGKGGRLIPRVAALLRERGVEVEMLVCASPEDPERLAREAAGRGAGIVAALGGDGQVGMCANGVLGTEAALAVIPAGTGNDFAACLGLDPRDPLAAAGLLADPPFRRIDAVRVQTPQGTRHYVNVAGVGFDSEVNAVANRMPVVKGTVRYVAALFAVLPRFRPVPLRVELDGAPHEVPAMMIVFGNAVSYGGGMRITPDALLDDGLLDVCVIGDVSKPDLIRTFPKVFRGRHVAHPKVRMHRARVAAVDADRPLQVFADGEHVGTTPARFEVLPGVLSVVAPAPGPAGPGPGG